MVAKRRGGVKCFCTSMVPISMGMRTHIDDAHLILV
jgi:hypothetical protein